MKIIFFVSSRADYELVYPLITKINKKYIKAKLIASGDLFSKKYGFYYKKILSDKILINYAIKYDAYVLSNVQASSLIIKKAEQILKKEKPNYIFLVGDKFESLSFGIACMLHNIPIIHYGGGQLSAGAWDDRCRHSISKMSVLHFVSTGKCKKRLIQLGEVSSKIVVTGSISIEVQKKINLYKIKFIQKFLNLQKNQKYILVTIHPTTLQENLLESQLRELFLSFENLQNIKIVFTFPNSDRGSNIIIKKIEKYCRKKEKFIYYKNLGKKLFLSLLKYSSIFIGNSSSGIIEAPTYGIASIDLGERQKDRERASSVFFCPFEAKKLSKLIMQIMSHKHKKLYSNPYKKKNTIQIILKKLYSLKKSKSLIKKFIDKD